jgi:TPP-dependent indolepyruvate ferredoxin oxidoreductase alpha subunit
MMIMNNSIKDTYLVVDTDTKAVFGHYDTPGKANGQVKRKGSRYAVYVVDAVHPLTPPKKVIEDLTRISYNKNLEDCKEYMLDGMVERECEEAGFACHGDDRVTDYFIYQGKCYKIKVSIEWDRREKQFYFVDSSSVVSCEECECPE